MPRPKKIKTLGEQMAEEATVAEPKKVICGHEEIVHKPDCKVCHSLKAFCGQRWNRCGAHGEHHEVDCQKLCV